MKQYITSWLYGCSLVAFASTGAAAEAQGANKRPPSNNQPFVEDLDQIVVTARRTSEILERVPAAASVISAETIDSRGVFGPTDLQTYAIGLQSSSKSASADFLQFSIRGQNATDFTDFGAVQPYFDEVPIYRLTSGSFFDLANVQVLRGPQGVLFGRVTNGGNIMITPQHPTEEFDGYLSGKIGNYQLLSINGAVNIPVIDEKILLRASFSVERRKGYTKNIYDGRDLDNVATETGRLGLTLRPFDGFENTTTLQYQKSHTNGTASHILAVNPVGLANAAAGVISLFPGAYGINSDGNVRAMAPGLTPLTVASYVANIQRLAVQSNELGPRKVSQTAPLFSKIENIYIVNRSKVEIGSNVDLTGIFSYIDEKWKSSYTFSGSNGPVILTCNSACASIYGRGPSAPDFHRNQYTGELRLAGNSFDNKLTWSLGAYADKQMPTGQPGADVIQLGILESVIILNSTNKSLAGFAFAEYDASGIVPGLKINGGVRRSHNSVKAESLFAASPIAAPGAQPALAAILPFILQAQGLSPAQAAGLAPGLAAASVNTPLPYDLKCADYAGGLFAAPCLRGSATFNAVTWTAGASYEPSRNLFLYAKVGTGYRPGGVNVAGSAAQARYLAERDTSVELGLKGTFNIANRPFRANLALFHDTYSDIQKKVGFVENGVNFAIVTNAQRAKIKGLELETSFRPSDALKIGANYAYVDGGFKHVDTSGPTDPCDPNAFRVLGFCTDNLLSFTPKHQVNITVDYTVPLRDSLGSVTLGAQYYYQSSFAPTDTSALTPNSLEPGRSLVNLSANWNDFLGKPIDLSFFVTNLTNKLYAMSSQNLLQNSSVGIKSTAWAPPRMFGFGINYRFGAGADR
jgi:iron complex outermembrane receptor protein